MKIMHRYNKYHESLTICCCNEDCNNQSSLQKINEIINNQTKYLKEYINNENNIINENINNNSNTIINLLNNVSTLIDDINGDSDE